MVGNSFFTTNEILIVKNHIFEKLLESPHIKPPNHIYIFIYISLSLSLSIFFFSLLCSLSPRSSLFSYLHPVNHGRTSSTWLESVAWVSVTSSRHREVGWVAHKPAAQCFTTLLGRAQPDQLSADGRR